MTPNAIDVQERLKIPVEPEVMRDQALSSAGVYIPTRKDAAPFRAAGARRPWLLAFLLRLLKR